MPGVTPHALYRWSSSGSVPRQLGSLAHCSFFKIIFPSEALCDSHRLGEVPSQWAQSVLCLPPIQHLSPCRSNCGFLLSLMLNSSRAGSVLGHLCAQGLSRVWYRTDPRWYTLSRGQKGQVRSLGWGGMPSVSCSVECPVLQPNVWQNLRDLSHLWPPNKLNVGFRLSLS